MIKRSGIQIEIDYAILVGTAIAINLVAILKVRANSADYSFLVESDWYSCQQISAEYREVYAFETPSFYVNICQKDKVYFYSGEAKQSNVNSIFIPATPLEHNRGFKADNGNVSYMVILPFLKPSSIKDSTLDPEEAILTIKRNDRLVSVESSLNKYCDRSDAIALDEIDPHSFNHLVTVTQEQISLELSSNNNDAKLPPETFDSNSRFDFYRIDGKLHHLTTCS